MRKINELVCQHKVDFLTIQENKLESITYSLFYALPVVRIVMGLSTLGRK